MYITLENFCQVFLFVFFVSLGDKKLLKWRQKCQDNTENLSVTNIWNRYFVSVSSLENSNLGNFSLLVPEFLACKFFGLFQEKIKIFEVSAVPKKVTMYLQLQSNLSIANKSYKRACLLIRGAKKVTHVQKYNQIKHRYNYSQTSQQRKNLISGHVPVWDVSVFWFMNFLAIDLGNDWTRDCLSPLTLP